jgi:phosphoserine phosphatase
MMTKRLILTLLFLFLLIFSLAACSPAPATTPAPPTAAPPSPIPPTAVPPTAFPPTSPPTAETQAAPASDPLPSWNPGPAKNSILDFVAGVTQSGGPSYVPPAERIAVFDNDGTLWTEKPLPVQGAFVFDRINQMAPEHPEWQTTQPYQAVLEKDPQALAALSEEDIAKLIAVTHAGMTVDQFTALVKSFLETALHPRFQVPYTQTVYQPMLELLDYLRANDFKTFIVSGGGTDFMRAFSEPVYGIPLENVIGSSLKYQFQLTDSGAQIMRLPEVAFTDNKEDKPVNIQRIIGRRPILAAGNSDGDLAMFQFTGSGPSLVLLLVHDDAEREYDYLDGTDQVMTAAAQSPWMFVSMKRDFARMFP